MILYLTLSLIFVLCVPTQTPLKMARLLEGTNAVDVHHHLEKNLIWLSVPSGSLHAKLAISIAGQYATYCRSVYMFSNTTAFLDFVVEDPAMLKEIIKLSGMQEREGRLL